MLSRDHREALSHTHTASIPARPRLSILSESAAAACQKPEINGLKFRAAPAAATVVLGQSPLLQTPSVQLLADYQSTAQLFSVGSLCWQPFPSILRSRQSYRSGETMSVLWPHPVAFGVSAGCSCVCINCLCVYSSSLRQKCSRPSEHIAMTQLF